MTLNLTSIIYLAVGLIAAVYVFVPAFRAQVNQLFRVTWGKIFGSAVSPIDRQKDQYKQAVELLKQQKESVVKLTATADLAGQDLTKRNAKVTDAIKKYTDAKDLKMDDAALNKYALAVKEAKDGVESQKANVELANANVKRATESLARTAEKINKFGQHIQDNAGKLALAEALNIQAKAEELAGSIDNVLSDAGQADQEIDRILAEANARSNMNAGDPADAELDKRRKEKEAADERAKLDAELSGGSKQ